MPGLPENRSAGKLYHLTQVPNRRGCYSDDRFWLGGCQRGAGI